MTRKYREYEFSYERHNPQNGVHVHTSKVIAFSKANAIKEGKNFCKGGCYGYNIFLGLVGEPGPVLTEGVDYRIENSYDDEAHSWRVTGTHAEKIYHF